MAAPVTDLAPRARWRPAAGDLALAAGVLFLQVAGTAGAAQGQEDVGHLGPVAFLLLALGPVALVARRRHPVPVLGVAFASALTYWTTDLPHGPVFLSLIVAFVTAALAGHRAVAWAFMVAGWVLFPWLPTIVGTEDRPPWGFVFGLGAWLLVLGIATEFVRSRREQGAEAERARQEALRRQASEERLDMAQELHDVLAHNISLISVQAGVALHLLDEQPERARPALAAIKEVSGEALGELRRVLDLLRADDGRAPRHPAPTLADLDQLVARSAAAGLDVTLQVHGDPGHLPGEVERSAFRIVQESLTNATRYAASAAVRVQVDVGVDDVVVQVDDDGPGSVGDRQTGTGSGITGMRARAVALGGTLDAGDRPGRGFRVRAWLPVRAANEEVPG